MSGKGWDDIDAVIMGKAPDFFEGVMMPEVYLAEALGWSANRSCGSTPPDQSVVPPHASPRR